MRRLDDGSPSPYQSFRCYLDTRLLDRINIATLDSIRQPTLSFLLNELLEDYVLELEDEDNE
jgi:hypothetical protein